MASDPTTRFLAVCEASTPGATGFSAATVINIYHAPVGEKPVRVSTMAHKLTAGSSIADVVFSGDSRMLFLLGGGPAWEVVGYEWRSGSLAATLEVRSEVSRVVPSPPDGSRLVTCGPSGVRLWRRQAGRLVPTAPILGGLGQTKTGLSDVAWLSSDRLAVVSADGYVAVISSIEVLQDWQNLCTEGISSIAEVQQQQSCATCSMFAVAAFPDGFVAGGTNGRVAIFRHTEHGSGAGGRSSGDRDGGIGPQTRKGGSDHRRYALVKVLDGCLSGDIVRLHCLASGGTNESAMLAVTNDGSSGFLNLHAADSHALSDQAPGSLGGAAAATAEAERGGASKVDAAGGTPSLGVEERGFSRALSAFEMSLADNGNVSNGARSAAYAAAGTQQLFRRCADDVAGGFSRVLSLAACSLRPLLAAITTGPGHAEIRVWNYANRNILVRHSFLGHTPLPAGSDGGKGAADRNGRSDAEGSEGVGDDGGGSLGAGSCSGTIFDGTGTVNAEPLVTGVATERRGVLFAGATDADTASQEEEDPSNQPLALAVHPAGHHIVVGFPGCIRLYDIIGGVSASGRSDSSFGSGSGAGAGAGATAAAAVAVAGSLCLAAEVTTTGVIRAAAGDRPVINQDPASLLRFSSGGHLLAVVTGKIVQILALNIVPAGAGALSGGLVRRQTLAGHAAPITAFRWGAHDRLCWTAAGSEGAVYEWDVGPYSISVGGNGTIPGRQAAAKETAPPGRRAEFVSSASAFSALAVGAGSSGGVVACGYLNPPSKRRQAKASSLSGAGRGSRPAGKADSAVGGGNSLAGGSLLYLWPQWLDSQGPGLEARAAQSLTHLATTAGDAALGSGGIVERNLLVGATQRGALVFYDWGMLIQKSAGGGPAANSTVADTPKTRPSCRGSNGGGENSGGGGGNDKSGVEVASHSLPLLVELSELHVHDGPITALALTPDCRYVFTTAADGAIFMSAVDFNGTSAGGSSGGGSGGDGSRGGSGGSGSAVPQSTDSRLSVEQHLASGAAEPPRDEAPVLMEPATVRSLAATAAAAATQLEHVRHQSRFQLARNRTEARRAAKAAAAESAGTMATLQARIGVLESQLAHTTEAATAAATAAEADHRRSLMAAEAAYEKRLAAQAEAYLKLRLTVGQLAVAAREEAVRARTMAEAGAGIVARDKEAQLRQLQAEHQSLREYAAFVRRQCEALSVAEEARHDGEAAALRAAANLERREARLQVAKVRGESLNYRKELNSMTKRLDSQAEREVDALMALESVRGRVAVLQGQVRSLEIELAAKSRRLSEWENSADEQKHEVRDLNKLRSALTAQLFEQRAAATAAAAALDRHRRQDEEHELERADAAQQVAALRTRVIEASAAARAAESTTTAAQQKLRRREAAVAAMVAGIAATLGNARDERGWLQARAAITAIVEPLLAKSADHGGGGDGNGGCGDGSGGGDGSDPEEQTAEAEARRQRARLEHGLAAAQKLLRRTEGNHRKAAKLGLGREAELLDDLNELRRANGRLQTKLTKARASADFAREQLWHRGLRLQTRGSVTTEVTAAVEAAAAAHRAPRAATALAAVAGAATGAIKDDRGTVYLDALPRAARIMPRPKTQSQQLLPGKRRHVKEEERRAQTAGTGSRSAGTTVSQPNEAAVEQVIATAPRNSPGSMRANGGADGVSAGAAIQQFEPMKILETMPATRF